MNVLDLELRQGNRKISPIFMNFDFFKFLDDTPYSSAIPVFKFVLIVKRGRNGDASEASCLITSKLGIFITE